MRRNVDKETKVVTYEKSTGRRGKKMIPLKSENETEKNTEIKEVKVTEKSEPKTAPKRRGRPPKKKTEEKTIADKAVETKEEVKDEAPKTAPKRRGRPPKKKTEEKTIANKAVETKEEVKDEAPKTAPKRRGRPPKKKTEKKAIADKVVETKKEVKEEVNAFPKPVLKIEESNPKSSAEKQEETKPKPKRRGRPPKKKAEEKSAGILIVKDTPKQEVKTNFPKPTVKIEESNPKSSAEKQEETKPTPKRRGRPPKKKAAGVITVKNTPTKEIFSAPKPTLKIEETKGKTSDYKKEDENPKPAVKVGENKGKVETVKPNATFLHPILRIEDTTETAKTIDEKKSSKDSTKQDKNKKSNFKQKKQEVDISVYTIKDGKLKEASEKIATEIEIQKEHQKPNVVIKENDIDVQVFEIGEEEPQKQKKTQKHQKQQGHKNRPNKQEDIDVEVEVYDMKVAAFPHGKTKPVIEAKREPFHKKNVAQHREHQKAATEAKKQNIKKQKNNQKPVQPKPERTPQPKPTPVQVVNKNEKVEYRLWNNGKQEKQPKQKIGSTAFLAKIGISELPKECRLTAKQKLIPEVIKVLSAVDKFLSKEIYIDNTISLLVAVSGGVDSMTLLDALAILSEKYYYTVQAAHYNHNLRGEDSFKDAEFVKTTVENYGFEYFSARGDVRGYANKNKLSIEHSARILRYNFFERTSRSNNSDFVATAHTADDSAETFLLNLMRGTGLTGLSGIPSKRNLVKNVVLVRPFISLTKDDIIAYAKARDLRWREDKSNATHDHTRNVIRHKLIPMITKEFNPNAIEAINRAAKLINGAEQNVTMQVEAALPSMIFDVRTERFSVKSNILMTFDEFMRGEILQFAISKHLRIQTLPMQKIDAIVNQIGKTPGKEIDIAPGMKAIYDRNTIIFGKIESNIIGSVPISYTDFTDINKYKLMFTRMDRKQVKFNRNPKIEFFDAEKLPDNLIVRPWKEGDFFSPLGMEGTMKVSDFLINEKVPNIDKPNVLVIATEDSDEVFWVCGYRINDRFKITDKTRKALKGEYYTL